MPVESAETMNCLKTCLRNSEMKPRSLISMSRSASASRFGSKAPDLSWKLGFVVMTCAQSLVGNAEAELARLVVDRRFAQQLLQDAAIEADLARLLVGERTPEPALILLDRPIVGHVIVLGRDFRASNRRDGGRAETPQHIADAPDDEADDDEPHDDGHDRLADDTLGGIAHQFEHFAVSAFPSLLQALLQSAALTERGYKRALSSGA